MAKLHSGDSYAETVELSLRTSPSAVASAGSSDDDDDGGGRCGQEITLRDAPIMQSETRFLEQAQADVTLDDMTYARNTDTSERGVADIDVSMDMPTQLSVNHEFA